MTDDQFEAIAMCFEARALQLSEDNGPWKHDAHAQAHVWQRAAELLRMVQTGKPPDSSNFGTGFPSALERVKARRHVQQ